MAAAATGLRQPDAVLPPVPAVPGPCAPTSCRPALPSSWTVWTPLSARLIRVVPLEEAVEDGDGVEVGVGVARTIKTSLLGRRNLRPSGV